MLSQEYRDWWRVQYQNRPFPSPVLSQGLPPDKHWAIATTSLQDNICNRIQSDLMEKFLSKNDRPIKAIQEKFQRGADQRFPINRSAVV